MSNRGRFYLAGRPVVSIFTDAGTTPKPACRWSPSKGEIDLDYWYPCKIHISLALCNDRYITDVMQYVGVH